MLDLLRRYIFLVANYRYSLATLSYIQVSLTLQ